MIVTVLFMEDELTQASWKDWILFLTGSLRALKIEGDSMAPKINKGDIVLLVPRSYEFLSKRTRFIPRTSVSLGDIVIARHPYRRGLKILKRVREIDVEGNMFLRGDNDAESTDSRTLGWFAPKEIEGRVVCRLK
jgi:nickel-type superoxide dismutase maturation protease